MRRVNLLRAHGSPTGYLYARRAHGCRCRICRIAWNERSKRYYAANREKHAEYCAKSNSNKPSYYQERHRIKKYGLDASDWDELFQKQGGRCAICGTDQVSPRRGWHTDHDHEAGAVRGILCPGCNVGLGHFREDPKILAAAIEYLATARHTVCRPTRDPGGTPT